MVEIKIVSNNMKKQIITEKCFAGASLHIDHRRNYGIDILKNPLNQENFWQ